MKTNEFIFLDGGMGTMLQAAGLPVGMMPELWNLTAPEKVTAVHRQYVEAGSQIVYTNTFGANRLKLGEKRALTRSSARLSGRRRRPRRARTPGSPWTWAPWGSFWSPWAP